MRHDQYRFRFYLNASHGIYLSGKLGEIHPHTWEIVLNVLNASENFASFHEVEKICESFLSNFQDVLINEIPPFTTINPTLENLAAYFKEEIQKRLRGKGWLLLSIELSETPARTYIISAVDEVPGGRSSFNVEGEETLQKVLDGMVAKRIDSLEKVHGAQEGGDPNWEKSLKEAEKKAITKLGVFNKKSRNKS